MSKNILKGMIIGTASLLPGISGGTMAVSMGMYDKVIHALNTLFTDTKKSVQYLFPILLGVGISMLCSIFGIDYLFDTFPLETNVLFIGLILGGLPSIYQKANQNRKGIRPILAGILFGIIITVFAFLGGIEPKDVVLSLEWNRMILLFLVGILAAATLIIPGVSGSMLLLLIGYYHPILEQIKNCITGVLTAKWNEVIGSVLILLPFAIGIAFGMLALARMIDIVFRRYPTYADWCIVGLIVFSPIAMLKLIAGIQITWINGVVAALLLIAGWKLGKKWG